MKPMIGVTPLYDEKNDALWIRRAYMEAISAAGAIPLLLPLTSKKKTISQLAGKLDGFLFTGGEDIDPALYGQSAWSEKLVCCPRRDVFEKALMQQVLVRDKPLLAICRGHQMLNVVQGGSLIQDIASQRHEPLVHAQSKPYDAPAHDMLLVEQMPLHNLIKKERWPVNSLHHQAVDHLGKDLKVMAYSSDGIIEAMYMPDKKLVWGVQWHPERMPQDLLAQAVFYEFVHACQAQR